jgi:hypothetical protein
MEPPDSECRDELVTVPGTRDDEPGLPERKPGADELRDRFDEERSVLVEMHDMISLRRVPDEIRPPGDDAGRCHSPHMYRIPSGLPIKP